MKKSALEYFDTFNYPKDTKLEGDRRKCLAVYSILDIESTTQMSMRWFTYVGDL